MIIRNNRLETVYPEDIEHGTLIIPNDVKVIGMTAIYNLPDLTSIILPETLEQIEREGITHTGIQSLIVPEGVKQIGDFAFAANVSLSFVKILNPSAFFKGNIVQSCYNLSQIQVGLMKYPIACWKQGNPYKIISKREVDGYMIYSLEPFRHTYTGIVHVAEKDGCEGDGVTVKRAIAQCKCFASAPDITKAYQTLSLDSHISFYDYRRITGIKDEVMVDFIKKHDFSDDSTITVRDLIPMLTPEMDGRSFGQFVANRYKERAEGGNNG